MEKKNQNLPISR